MAKDGRFDPARLDLQAFAAAGGALEGELPLTSLPRVAESSVAIPGGMMPAPVQWFASGQLRAISGAQPQVWLQLRAKTELGLQCQRCLQPMLQRLEIDRWFRFVADEDEAERLDEDSDDDVLVLSPRFDLFGLLEDELILALPLVALHDACPQPLPLAQGTEQTPAEAVPHAFAALAALRRPPLSS